METAMPTLLVMVPIATIGILISTLLLAIYAGIILTKIVMAVIKYAVTVVPQLMQALPGTEVPVSAYPVIQMKPRICMPLPTINGKGMRCT